MPNASLKIVNTLGLHARAAAKFVGLAKTFEATVQIGREDRLVDGKSIMNVMLLAAPLGSQVDLKVSGADEDAAFADLCDLIRQGFHEDVVDD